MSEIQYFESKYLNDGLIYTLPSKEKIEFIFNLYGIDYSKFNVNLSGSYTKIGFQNATLIGIYEYILKCCNDFSSCSEIQKTNIIIRIIHSIELCLEHLIRCSSNRPFTIEI